MVIGSLGTMRKETSGHLEKLGVLPQRMPVLMKEMYAASVDFTLRVAKANRAPSALDSFAEARLKKATRKLQREAQAQAKQSRARAGDADFDAPAAGKRKYSESLVADQQPHCTVTRRRRHSDQDAPPLLTPDEHGGKLNKKRKRVSRVASQRKKLNLVPTEAGNDSGEVLMLTCEHRESRVASRKRARTPSGDGRSTVKWIAFSFDGWTRRRAMPREPD